MNTYEILLSGTGIEAYLFSLDPIRLQISEEIDLSEPLMDVIKNLGLEDPGRADIIITGLLENDFTITIRDDIGNPVSFSYYWDIEGQKEYYENGLSDDNYLTYAHKISGEILKSEIVVEDDFDFEKIGLVFTNIGYKNILTGLSYDGEYLFMTTDYLDYESLDEEIYKVINNPQ